MTVAELLGWVRHSTVGEIIIFLDCCFSGAAGDLPQIGADTAHLRSGVSILAASRGDQKAIEQWGRGMFSAHLQGALDGGAADVLGRVTIASVYAYLTELFGPWDQRPTFKSNVEHLHVLRHCRPAVPLDQLRRLTVLFPDDTASSRSIRRTNPPPSRTTPITSRCSRCCNGVALPSWSSRSARTTCTTQR